MKLLEKERITTFHLYNHDIYIVRIFKARNLKIYKTIIKMIIKKCYSYKNFFTVFVSLTTNYYCPYRDRVFVKKSELNS